MSRRLGPDAPAHYELRVQGHLDDSWSTWFDGMALSRENNGTTTMRGLVTDQAALHGLLAKVRDIGATLSPFNAWLGLRGIATMHLRIERSCDSALQVARFLQDHPQIDAVHYPALEGSPSKARCDHLLGGRGAARGHARRAPSRRRGATRQGAQMAQLGDHRGVAALAPGADPGDGDRMDRPAVIGGGPTRGEEAS